ncbi:MAG: glucose-6-phosphate isomerase, partial [Alicyclobacillus sp.]|nr:glucose-6-phosphate isomerase [Alicyclobacillus sp.]
MVTLDLQFALPFVREDEWQMLQPLVAHFDERLRRGEVPGGDFLGWLHLPSETLKRGLNDIAQAASSIRDQADALVVIGIGGSYLGARAVFEWVKPEYYNQLPANVRGGPELYFAGNHLSGGALNDLLRLLEGKRVALNVISKSGTTTEPAVAFRILRAWLTKQ